MLQVYSNQQTVVNSSKHLWLSRQNIYNACCENNVIYTAYIDDLYSASYCAECEEARKADVYYTENDFIGEY